MKSKIITVQLKDKKKVINFLKKNHKFKLTNKQYESLFNNNWSKNKKLGIAIKVNQEIVGFIGLLFSDNFFYLKTKIRIANIHSWVVKKDFRYLSLSLLNKLNDKGYIFVSQSTLLNLKDIFLKMGWKILDKNFFMIPLFFNSSKKISYNFDFKKSKNLKKFVEDHVKYNCKYMNINYGKLEIIFKLKKKKLFNFAEILFLNDLNYFNKYLQSIIKVLFKEYKVILVKTDERFLNNNNKKLYKLFKVSYKTHLKVFRNSGSNQKIKNSHISNLYSEFQLI